MPAGEDFVQLLDPAGNRVEHPDFSYSGTDADLAASLRDLVLTRRFDLEATALQRKGELGLWPPSLGQEAAQVGSARAAQARDRIVPSYREHGVAWVRGVDLKALLGVFRGSGEMDFGLADRNFHLYTWVIGGQALPAVGLGMALQRDGLVGGPDPEQNAAVITYFGDGATSQGELNESFVFASSFGAPVVFFCQNNQWAISEPIALQSRIPLHRRAAGFGFPGVRVDGNDVLACEAVTRWALDRARNGEGPTLIEAYTYRMGAHTTSDDPTRYRSSTELDAWRAKDPIERVKTYLLNQGAIDDRWLADLAAESDAFAEQLRTDCTTLPEPDLAAWWDRVYAETPHTLTAQRDGFLAYRNSFEEA